jgi:polar amino acid transport system substrate-binding protein
MQLHDWPRRAAALLTLAVLCTGCSQNQPAAPGSGPASGAPGTALLTSVDDLKDKRIAVQLGTVYDLYATKTFPNATVLQYPTFQEVTLSVSTGKADAGLSDIDVLNEVMRANPDLVTVGKPIFKSPVAAGFRKTDADRRTAFNAFLKEIRQNGVWADMVDRWMTKRDQKMPELPKAATRGTVVVGTSSGGFPFAAVQNNELAGFDIELARRYGAYIGAEIRFVDQDFAAHIAALVSGKIDVILASMFDTEERRQRIDFSEPYFEQDSYAFSVKANTAAAAPQSTSGAPAGAPLTSVDDLKDKRIAVQLGTVYDLYATKTFPNAQVLQYPTFQEVTLSVSTGKTDAGLSDIDVLNEVMRANPDLVTIGKPIFKSPVAAGFRKADADRRTAFNAFLKEIRQNGVWADMVDRWMTKRDQKMPTLPAGATRGTVVVGTSSGGFPFAAVQNNELAGFDIELARRYGAYIGAEIRFVDQDFAAHIAALVSGRIDVILASMFDTEERRQRIDFSDAYFEQDSYAFTVKANTVAAGATAAAAPAAPSFVESVKASFRSNVLVERRYLLIRDGLKTTAIIAVLATFFGTALGALVCFMRMSPLAILRVPAKIYIDIVRGIPVLVLLMLIFYVVFASVDISPIFVAVVAFGMNFAAYVSEMFRSGIESIDRGQSEAGIAMGFTRAQTFRFIVMPQMIQRILPVYKGEFISMVKMTSIVGYIAVQDLTKASDIIRSRTFDPFFPLIMVAVLYFVIAWVLLQALEYLERNTDPKYRRRKAVAR